MPFEKLLNPIYGVLSFAMYVFYWFEKERNVSEISCILLVVCCSGAYGWDVEEWANFHCVGKSLVDRQIIGSLAVMLGSMLLVIGKIKINILKEFLVFSGLIVLVIL